MRVAKTEAHLVRDAEVPVRQVRAWRWLPPLLVGLIPTGGASELSAEAVLASTCRRRGETLSGEGY